MNAPGVLLDTGPLVALLSKNDAAHARAKRLFASCQPPLRCCEPVVAEACFLLRRLHPNAPAEMIALGKRGAYDIDVPLRENWSRIGAIMRKYADQPISLADACLIRCAEVHDESRVLTFDRDFSVYRWGQKKRFEILE